MGPLFATPSLIQAPAVYKLAELEKEVDCLWNTAFDGSDTNDAERMSRHGQLFDAVAKLTLVELKLADEMTKCQELDETAKRLVKEKGTVEAERDGLATTLASITYERDTLRLSLEKEEKSHKDTIDDITTAWGILDDQFEAEKVKSSQLVSDCAGLLAALEQERKTAADSLTAVTADRDELSTAIIQSRAEYVTLANQLDYARASASAAAIIAANEHKALVSELEAAQVENIKLAVERDGLSVSFDRVKKDSASAAAAAQMSRGIISNLRTAVDEEAEKRNKLEASLTVVQIQRSQLNNQVERLSGRCDILSSSNEVLEAEKAAVSAALLAEQQKSADLEARLVEMTRLLENAQANAAVQETRATEAEKQRDACVECKDEAKKALEWEKQAQVKAQELYEREKLARLEVERKFQEAETELAEVKGVIEQLTSSFRHEDFSTSLMGDSVSYGDLSSSESFQVGFDSFEVQKTQGQLTLGSYDTGDMESFIKV